MTLHNFDFDDEGWFPDTVRSTSQPIIVEEKCVLLFLTKSYSLIFKVADKVIAESKGSALPLTQGFKSVWVRNILRTKQQELELLGVDVKQEYTNWGGNSSDL